jgi:hypothetical protein
MINMTRERRVARGLCGDCGKKPARPRRLFCDACSIKRNTYGKNAMRRKKRIRTRDHERCTLCRKPGHDRRTCDMFGAAKRRQSDQEVQEVMQPWTRPQFDRPDGGGDEGDEFDLAPFRWDSDGS